MLVLILTISAPPECEGLSEDEIPIILVHGLMAGVNDMYKLRDQIRQDFPNRRVQSIEILFGVISSILEMPDRYLRAAVTSIQEAAGGAKCIDLIGHSQGGFMIRAYTQMYSWQDDCPRVRRLYSLAGVQAGYYCYDSCGSIKKGNPLMLVAHLLTQPTVVYSNFAKLTVVPSTEWKDPMAMDHYSRSDILISQINGESVTSPNITDRSGKRTVAIGRDQIVQLDRFYTFYSPAD